MEINAITKLASLLRENGDKVLNGQSKFSLVTSLLQNLNEAFRLVVENSEECDASFHVLQNTNSDVQILHDIQFLHDFVQKTVGLKLTNDNGLKDIQKGRLDVAKFRSLKYLEVRKIPIHYLYGIQSIRSQLQSVVCIRCIQKLGDFLSDCGGDGSSGFPWSELREAVFSYNGIITLDHSLQFTPWLQILDLSHNKICSAEAIDFLPNLKYLNISYNLLESIPSVNKDACRKLEVLVIKNNYIEDLTGLMALENLVELDLSCNCLTDHQALEPLLYLSALTWLSLEGNPLSFHPQHRLRTAHHLHNSSACGKFMLDRIPLSRSERLAVGSYSDVTVSQRSAIKHDSSSTAASTPEQRHLKNDVYHHATKSQTGGGAKKSSRVREAQIIEHDDSDTTDYDDLSASIKTGSIDLSTDHLETKRKIEVLREKFGKENWLHSKGGSCVQDVLGLQKSTASAPGIVEYNPFSSSAEGNTPPSLTSNKALDASGSEVSDSRSHVIHTAEVSVHVSADTISEDTDVLPLEYEEPHSSSEQVVGCGEEKTVAMEDYDEEEEEEEEEDGDEEELYLVQKKKKDCEEIEELFLVVTERWLKEREALSGRTRERWTIASLLSCVRTASQFSSTEVQITFDTVRQDRQERSYLMDGQDAQKLLKFLGDILEARPLTAMNQAAFRCMKCSAQFSCEMSSVSTGLEDKVLMCPTCNSKMVIQMEEVPLPSCHTEVQGKGVEVGTSGLTTSPSQSSIGKCDLAAGTGSSHRDRLQASALVQQTLQLPPCSATSLESSEEYTNNVVENVRRWGSDIEILSNPSQSSIEVLDEQGKPISTTPARKRSSEERQMTSLALPVQDVLEVHETESHVFSHTGLTESSSSGSLTDSICTTYEIRGAASPPSQLDKTEEEGSELEKTEASKSSVKASQLPSSTDTQEKELPNNQQENSAYTYTLNKKNDSLRTDYTTMLKGLLQSVGSKLKPMPLREDEGSRKQNGGAVEYSYTDFSLVDHRVKLHLYINLFQQEQEELLFLLRAQIVTQPPSRSFPGCLVISTKNIYILEIIGVEGEDPEHWLNTVASYTINRLLMIFVLPWLQGVGVDLQMEPGEAVERYLFVVYDTIRTKNAISYLKNVTLLNDCKLLEEPLESQTLTLQQLVLSAAMSDEMDATICLFAILSDCSVNRNEETTNLGMAALTITSTDLVLIESNMTWLFSKPLQAPQSYSAQKMSNLIEMEITDVCSLNLQFLDERANSEESWLIKTGTESALQSIINAIRNPWEDLFSVPLQVVKRTIAN